jgi:hypothetical protein
VVSSDNEYSYATTDVKRSVSISSDHVTIGVAYSVPQKQRLSTGSAQAYEDIDLQKKQPKRSVNSEKDGTYAVPDATETKDPGESAVPSTTEYSYARPDSVRLSKVSADRLVVGAATTDHVTAGGVEYSVPHKQRLSTASAGVYEDIELASQQPKRSVNRERDSTYSVPDDTERKNTGESPVPSMTEYSYARPDSVRSMKISTDRLVVGAATTARQDEEESQPNDGENPYSLPDETKPKMSVQREPSLPPSDAEYAYAKPDVKRPILVAPSRLAVSSNQDALPTKQERSRADSIDKPSVARKPSNSPKRYTVEDVQYAIPDKQSRKKSSSSGQEKSDTRVSESISVHGQTEKEGSDRRPSLQLEHYQSGEDQYAVSTKSRSPSQYSKREVRERGSNQIKDDPYAKVTGITTDQPDEGKQNSRLQYAELDLVESERGKKCKPQPNEEAVKYATIDTTK